jgi:hypothetical protein
MVSSFQPQVLKAIVEQGFRTMLAVAGQRRNLLSRAPLRQKPNAQAVTGLHSIATTAIALFKLSNAKTRNDLRRSRRVITVKFMSMLVLDGMNFAPQKAENAYLTGF